jgi:phage terminase small subunit
MTDKQRKLTKLERFFVAEYQKDWNGAQAVIRAGSKSKNPDVIADQLLGKAWVAEALEKQVKERLRRIGVNSEKVLTRMAHLAFADIRKIFGDNGTLLDPDEWPDDIAAAVAGVEVFEEYQGKGADRISIGRTKKVKLWDPNPSLTNMAKNLGIIGNGKHHNEEEGEGGVGRTMTPLELSAKMFFYLELVMRRSKEIEGAKKDA